MNSQWPYSTPGIPDDLFIREKVPMTKEEIRILTLAKARLAPGQIVWDIGSGTGSISVEAALLVPGGKVFAVEKNARATQLTIQNAEKFGVNNLITVPGEAPAVLHDLPDPHRVIIGGSGGNLHHILQLAVNRLKPGGRIVANAVTVETFNHCTQFFTGLNWEAILVNISRTVPAGNVRMWRALNPVYIFTLEK
ncbi:precorrin-6Y C5,15-methyltransferase (decarboxylating) subunit CbiT [Desulfallas sp. Bu1-1]|jgi:precorrin-6Y C5,15-methyltransferase (decarboxylating) CbiT subunit|uniref:precorrin-6Y C5,15-methyltransferase (decarboxylating) subunit CbiT n=1 Tax=Desulfallas sp. Bu1-1 TaxID=2787620 RepID=UPI00189D21F9|nr:precorrin-6Y C5,15-methyltransferase (decarboxylating) subunit CbiT [Desulfallas sp. Bu1-1]MBF7083290.1 precorrin-6Y C5,15-methyltransferase (decarboxylating) subunit CbiT [Desulfallas sp. Bu1-1]